MKKRNFLIISLFLIAFIVIGITNSQFNGNNSQGNDMDVISNNSQSKDMEKLTPAQIINLYIISLKNGDSKILNSIYSNRALEYINSGKGFESFPPQVIKDVKMTVDKSKINNINESNYNLSFVLEKVTDPPFFYQGTGEYYYFVHLINEKNIWKIDALATSP